MRVVIQDENERFIDHCQWEIIPLVGDKVRTNDGTALSYYQVIERIFCPTNGFNVAEDRSYQDTHVCLVVRPAR